MLLKWAIYGLIFRLFLFYAELKPQISGLVHSRPLFYFQQFTADKIIIKFCHWIRTADLCYQKQLLYPQSQNNCPTRRLVLSWPLFHYFSLFNFTYDWIRDVDNCGCINWAIVATSRYNCYKNGPTPASFCLFSFFSNTILQKNCRLQRDSNSDCRSRKQARWPLDNHQGHISKIPINNKFALNWQCSRLNNQNLE